MGTLATKSNVALTRFYFFKKYIYIELPSEVWFLFKKYWNSIRGSKYVEFYKRKFFLQKSLYIVRNERLKITECEKTLPIMYWLARIHKTPIGTRCVAVSKNSSPKLLTDIMSKHFFFEKIFYSICKMLWVVENSFSIVTELNDISKSFSTFDFATLNENENV